jgi:transposase
VGVDAISCSAETIVDLAGFVVLAAGEYGGELELLVETTARLVHCEQCGIRAQVHDRKEHLLRDVPVSGRATVLVWWKRIWRCPNQGCAAKTWTERNPLAAPRRVLTERARAWVTGRVGRDGETVAAVARSLGVGWWSVMRAVVDVGSRLVAAGRRLDGVSGLGVDEHAWQRARAGRHTQFATGVVGFRPDRPARLLEVTPGRSGKVYADWLAAQPEQWRDQIRVAALDPFRGYLNALREHLPRGHSCAGCLSRHRVGDEGRRRGPPPRAADHPGSPRPQRRPAV